jgi:hypothetical protein
MEFFVSGIFVPFLRLKVSRPSKRVSCYFELISAYVMGQCGIGPEEVYSHIHIAFAFDTDHSRLFGIPMRVDTYIVYSTFS